MKKVSFGDATYIPEIHAGNIAWYHNNDRDNNDSDVFSVDDSLDLNDLVGCDVALQSNTDLNSSKGVKDCSALTNPEEPSYRKFGLLDSQGSAIDLTDTTFSESESMMDHFFPIFHGSVNLNGSMRGVGAKSKRDINNSVSNIMPAKLSLMLGRRESHSENDEVDMLNFDPSFQQSFHDSCKFDFNFEEGDEDEDEASLEDAKLPANPLVEIAALPKRSCKSPPPPPSPPPSMSSSS